MTDDAIMRMDGGDDDDVAVDGHLAGRAASSRETRGSGSQATSASKTTFSSRLTWQSQCQRQEITMIQCPWKIIFFNLDDPKNYFENWSDPIS